MATNAQVAEKLGVSHSTVSRMRTGIRVGSTETLNRIHREYGIPLDRVVDAAVRARAGKPTKWKALMKEILSA